MRKMPIELDKRIKIAPDERTEMVRLYADGMSIKDIAGVYNRHYQTVYDIVRRPHRKKYVEPSKRKRYYSREQNTAYQREYRQRMRELNNGD